MEPVDTAFEALLEYLKHERGFDFTGYKRPSLMRRVRRQMQQVGVETFEEYQDYLEVHPAEFAALFNMILINVTRFFRDPEAWQELRTSIIPSLLASRPTGVFRVWSAGCASGKEAFSLAMCLAEALGTDEFRSRVKIYATDVDEEALAEARLAVYGHDELKDVPADLLDAYFEPAPGDRMAFRKDLRRCVIFGRNDLVQDAPISRVDLLACRNTLMYFNSEQQSRILQRLHFALNPAGVLFIGKAETLRGHPHLYQAVGGRSRFFRKVPADALRDWSPVTLVPAGGEQPDAGRLQGQALLGSPLAHVVVDRQGLLAHANRRADALFGVGSRDVGRPFQDLELSYRPVELRTHIQHALTERRAVTLDDVEYRPSSGELLSLEVQVVPLGSEAEPVLGVAVFFRDVTAHRRLQVEFEYANRQLETAYEELHSTNEELETTNEELQSTVEELETTNEELQSTNEELETMNEELQSMNDELQLSNEELRLRTLEVVDANVFMQSVLAGLRAAVLVVDAEQRVLVWNRQADDLWGLRSDEVVGQYLLGLDISLPFEVLRPLLRAELDSESDDSGPTDGGLSGGPLPAPKADQPTPGARPGALRLVVLNRRGRSVDVRVTVSALRLAGAAVSGAIIVVEQQDDAMERAARPFADPVTG